MNRDPFFRRSRRTVKPALAVFGSPLALLACGATQDHNANLPLDITTTQPIPGKGQIDFMNNGSAAIMFIGKDGREHSFAVEYCDGSTLTEEVDSPNNPYLGPASDPVPPISRDKVNDSSCIPGLDAKTYNMSDATLITPQSMSGES